MSSSTVSAQKLANEANIGMVNQTNLTNRDIAESANRWNYQMFQEQNAWNLAQWQRENEYNSPKQQVQRYIEAGINPLWAIASGDPGNAQQLTSSSSAPANVASLQAPQVTPEFDPSRNSNIIAASQNVVNSLQGFMKLGLEAEDVETRRGAQQSQAALNLAEGLYKRSQTDSQNLFNRLTSDTYSVQVQSKSAEYRRLLSEIDNLEKQGKNIDAATVNLHATKEQITAQTDYIYRQSDAVIEQVKQGWKRLSIEQQSANTASYSAASSSYYQGQELKQRVREHNDAMSQFEIECKSKSNEQLIRLYEVYRSELDKYLPGTTEFFSDMTGDTPNRISDILDRVQTIGSVFKSRVVDNPTPDNIQSFDEWQKSVQKLQVPVSPSRGNAQGFSVLNPSNSWLP